MSGLDEVDKVIGETRFWHCWQLAYFKLSHPAAMPTPYRPPTLGQGLVDKSESDDSKIASMNNTESLPKMR